MIDILPPLRYYSDWLKIPFKISSPPSDVSVLFYGEGRRTRDGTFHDFKKGPFATAILNGLPVLPVAIAGSRDVWPPDTVRILPGPVALEVGEPISVDGRTFEDRDSLRDGVHAAVRELRARSRHRIGLTSDDGSSGRAIK